MSHMWQQYKKKLNVVQEQYGTEALIQSHNILEATLNLGPASLRYANTGKGNHTELLKLCKDLLGSYVSLQESPSDERYVFTDAHTYLSLDITKQKKKGDRACELDLVTTSKKIFDAIKAKASKLIEESPPSNRVFALAQTQRGLKLVSFGEFNQSLAAYNYAAPTLKGYKHIQKCLSSKAPCGRLVLMQGAPGTGKSYMIRSLVSSINATFIIVGSNMIADLSGPSILPLLLDTVEKGKPIAFILEDADVALADRGSKSGMTHLSGLLNLGDGLLGEMLDVRIIATTNASKMELDSAIQRPGRMCQHIEFDKLDIKAATKLYKKLAKKKTASIKTPLTLAEVYRMAREDGWMPPKPTKGQGQYI